MDPWPQLSPTFVGASSLCCGWGPPAFPGCWCPCLELAAASTPEEFLLSPCPPLWPLSLHCPASLSQPVHLPPIPRSQKLRSLGSSALSYSLSVWVSCPSFSLLVLGPHAKALERSCVALAITAGIGGDSPAVEGCWRSGVNREAHASRTKLGSTRPRWQKQSMHHFLP